MGAFLFAAGDERTVLPSAKVMIHQPMGGIQPGTQASDMKITCEQIQKTKMWLNSCLAEFTGQPLDIIEQDTDRDHWLNAQEAVDYGLADNIATSRKKKQSIIIA
jgi:ATP-dependent Clp protease protease subunit